MSSQYEAEIDLKDVFIFWLCHWKSLIVLLMIGLLCGIGFFKYKSIEAEKQNLAAVVDQEQAVELSVVEQMAVDDVVALYQKYEQLGDTYDEKINTAGIVEASEILSNMASVKNLIDGKRNSFNIEQMVYFYEQIGVDNPNGNPAAIAVAQKQMPALSRVMAVAVIIAAFLHILMCFCAYVSKGTIRHYENYSAMVGSNELTRVICWDKLSAISRWNFKDFKKIDEKTAISINVKAIEQIANVNGYEKIAIMSIDTEAGKDISDVNAVKSIGISSILYDTNGATQIADCDAAVLVVRVGETIKQHVIDESEALQLRDIKILGIIVFE